VEDGEKLKDLGERLKKTWEWAWTTEVDKDVERAIQMFEMVIGPRFSDDAASDAV